MASSRSRERLIWFFIPLYSRYRKKKAPDHFLRGQILEFIRQNPGCIVNDILKKTDINRSTLIYHLDVLIKNNYIFIQKYAGFRHYYPTGVKISNLPQYSTPTSEKIFQHIFENPGINIQELMKITKTSKQAIYHQLTRLKLDQRVTWKKVGRHRRWYMDEESD